MSTICEADPDGSGTTALVVERPRPSHSVQRGRRHAWRPKKSSRRSAKTPRSNRDESTEPCSKSDEMSVDDRRMVRLQQGERTAFEELVATHQGSLLGFFYKNTHDTQLSEDLTQETLLRVYSQAWDYLPLGRFRGWLFRIARNLLIDNVRRQSHDALVKAIKGSFDDDGHNALSHVHEDCLTSEQQANYRELATMLDDFLDTIPEEQRLTFTLHHFAGLTLTEVAEAMETSIPTSKSRLRLAREKLRALFQLRGIFDPNAPDPPAASFSLAMYPACG